jgi:hypothetical protein
MRLLLFRWPVALTILMAIVSWESAPVAGQTPAPAAKAAKPAAAPKAAAATRPAGTVKWTAASRTPDGQPDIQGYWNFQTATPLERPKEFAGKPFLTEAEAAAVEAKEAAENDDEVLTGAPAQGNPGTYNNFWNDPGLRVVPSRRSSLIVDTPDGKMPPLTPEAQKRRAENLAYRRAHPADTWVERGPNERCLSRPIPRILSSYKMGVQVLQVPGYVVLHYEYFHDTRIIPLDGRPHLDKGIQQWTGDSRGHWEGDTLVVDVTNFNEQETEIVRSFQGLNQKTLHLTERFKRVAPDILNYSVTFDDPATWTRPWTIENHWRTDRTQVHYEDACHEGNHGIVGILSGARADEKKGIVPRARGLE